MISRVTIYTLLFALMLGVGIRMWSDNQRDACSAYLAGVPRSPASEWVESGTRQVEVPCNDWFMRQPMRVQILCLLDVLLAVTFLMNALADLRDGLQMRRRMRGLE